MTKKEKLLAASLLNLASDEFGNHGCNDLEKKYLNSFAFTDEEKIQFMKEYHEYNGDPEEFENTPNEFMRMPDFAFMSFLSKKLEND